MEKGYKQTEIGVIPEDWEVEIFSKEITLKHGFQYLENHFCKSGVPVVKIGNLIDSGGIDEKTLTFVSHHIASKHISFQLKYGDVLMALTGATLGKVSKCNYKQTCLQNYRVGKFTGKGLVVDNFIFYLLQSELIQKTVKDLVNSGAQPNLGKADFEKIKIPVPPLPEQEKIAAALSDADAWIESLEQLIEKKRLIKQGAMQQLLTPKEDWEERKLGEFLDYIQPTNFIVKKTEYNPNNPIPVLTAGKSFILGYTDEEFNLFEKLPVIIFDDFTTSSKYVNFKFKVKSSAMKLLVPKNDQFSLRFIFELMQLIEFPLGDHKRHWIGEYQNILIKVPNLTEQIRIATILSDMDAEIESLEAELAKARQIKQGMMQVLLTGKVRLAVNC